MSLSTKDLWMTGIVSERHRKYFPLICVCVFALASLQNPISRGISTDVPLIRGGEDDSACSCDSFPVWRDRPFGRDNDTVGSLWRREEIDYALANDYTVSFSAVGRVSLGEQIVAKVTARKSSPAQNCGDSFYAQVHGTCVQEIQFQHTGVRQDPYLACVYSAAWAPLYAGVYHFNIWLTHVNESGHFEASRLQDAIRPFRNRLMQHQGRLKNVGLRVVQVVDVPEMLYGMPLALMNRDIPFRVPAKKFVAPLEPICQEPDLPGAFVHREACENDVSCRRMIQHFNTTFLLGMKYIWKPHGCRMTLYPNPKDFEDKSNLSARTKPFRVLFAGDSVHAEEYCALNIFLSGGDFEKQDCSKAEREKRIISNNALQVEYMQVWGFYDSIYGWRDYEDRSRALINQVLKTSKRFDLVIWNDAAHSLEKNDVADVVRIIFNTARTFEAGKKSRFAFRLHNYVHSLGPIGHYPNTTFYSSSTLLQPPRIALLNQITKKLLAQLRIPTYDSSIVHAARPEASRDKLHWGIVKRRGRCPPEFCSTYCRGLWVENADSFQCHRESPDLTFWSTQILLSFLNNILTA